MSIIDNRSLALVYCSVGQVQDAGLIFLSAMASFIAQYEREKGRSGFIIPTTLVALSLATSLVGIVIFLFNYSCMIWIILS